MNNSYGNTSGFTALGNEELELTNGGVAVSTAILGGIALAYGVYVVANWVHETSQKQNRK